jgi:hypothetical protein
MTRVGITGHRLLDNPKAWDWVHDALLEELARLRPPYVAVSSLAIGADQLLARLVLEQGGKLHAVLPFENIERSFSAEDVYSYRDLARQASVEILETEGSEEDAYLAAGQRVVRLSDVLIAVWDGMPAKGRGGTADIVRFAQREGVPIVHINPIDQTIRPL